MEALENYFFSYRPYASLIVFVLAVIVWKSLRRLVNRSLLRTNTKERTARDGTIQIVMNFVKYFIALVAGGMILQINGLNLSTMTAGLGIAGIIIGFSLQDLLNDWVMGLTIVWDNFFAVGDIVRYGQLTGRVISFNFKTTKLQDIVTGNIVVVSNRRLEEITLLSDWFDMDIPAPYDEPADRMRRVIGRIREECRELPEVDDCRFLGTQKFEASDILYRLRLYCKPDERGQVTRQVNGLVQDIYAEERVSIPYNQLDVHVVSVPPQSKS